MVDEIVAALRRARSRRRRRRAWSSPARRRRSAPAPTSSHLGGSQRARPAVASTRASSASARSPLPTIAAVNGAAVGAGMNLALACDVRLAGRSARFDTRFLQLGLHPGGGHTWMLQRIAGPQAAAAVVLFGEVLDGEEAERCGLVWRCVDDDALRDRRRAGGTGPTPRPSSSDGSRRRWPTSPDRRPRRGGRPRARRPGLVARPTRVRRAAGRDAAEDPHPEADLIHPTTRPVVVRDRWALASASRPVLGR